MPIADKELVMNGEAHLTVGVRPNCSTELAADGEVLRGCQRGGDAGPNDRLATMRIRCGVDESMRVLRRRDAYGCGLNTLVDRWRGVRDADDDLIDGGLHISVEL